MATPQEDSEIDLLELLRLFYANKFKIIFITLCAALIGLAVAFFSTPIYKADSLIQLEEKSSGGMALSADLSGLFADTPQSVAEVEILRSRMILGEVISALRLDISATPKRLPVIGNFLSRYAFPAPDISFLAPYAWREEGIEISRLTLPEALIGQPVPLTYLGGGAYEISLGGEVISGRVRTPLRRDDLGFALMVESITGQAGREFILKKQSFATALADLRAAYSISERGKGSSILQLSLQNPDPDLATRILAEIGDVYLLQNINRNAAEAESSLTFIQAQLPEAEATMRAAESAVNVYKLSQNSVDLSFETQALLEQSVDIQAQLNELALQERELQKRFTVAHPAYQTLLDNRAQLTQRLDEIQAQTVNLPETQLEMLRLNQNLEVAREIYLQLVNRAQELQVIKAGTIGNIRVIDAPMAFPLPVKPAKAMVLAVSVLVGFVLALALVLLRAYTRKGIDGQAQIEALGMPVYGTVQKVGNGDFGIAASKKNLRPVLAKSDPTNLSVEALRSLRTSLHFGMLDSNSSLLLITSSRPGEGKSFLAVNLATVMAQAGQNICLVDADIRRGYLRRYFGIEKSAPGLTDVLAGDAKIEDVIHVDKDTGLHFIPAGKYPPNPSELFMHKHFAEVCAYLDDRFELTLMDAAPILAVTDPVIIGKYTGMILLVVRHLFTQIGEVNASLRTLENNGLKASGTVLNAYAPKASNKGVGDYSYQYAYQSRD